MNFLYPPFDNVKVRRAAFTAINQKDVGCAGRHRILQDRRRVFVWHAARHEEGSVLVKGNGMAEAKLLPIRL
jgi:peptide/nickel transport system substrate-binding protein